MVVPLPVPTWILVTDASQAQVLEIRNRNDPPGEVPDFNFAPEDAHGLARDMKSDRADPATILRQVHAKTG